VRQPCRPALAEPAAHEESDGLAECSVSIPGDRHRLRVKIGGKVNSSTHKLIMSSVHLDALAPVPDDAMPDTACAKSA
jgi:hypothetical protein